MLSWVLLSWALTCVVIALIAKALGLGMVVVTASSVAKVLFVMSLVLFAISIVGRRTRTLL